MNCKTDFPSIKGQVSPALQAAFAHDGASPVAMSTAEFGQYIETEIAKWGRVVKKGKITAK
jgi:tripartite-type tricarboxylate transporter receptor subunit TctC